MDPATLAARHQQEAPRWRAAARRLRALAPHRQRLLLGVLVTLEAAVLIGLLSLLAWLLNALIIDRQAPPWSALAGLLTLALLRAALTTLRDQHALRLGQQVCGTLRQQLLAQGLHPAWRRRHGEGAGQLGTRLGPELDLLQPYFAGYLPALYSALLQPALILLVVFSQNWLAGLLLLAAAPMIPLFMAIIGMGVATLAAQQQQALARLGDHFLDRLRNLPQLRLSLATARAIDDVGTAANDWREAAMRVLRVAFLSSAVLEFFAAIAIASVAIYIGMALLGYLTWGPASSVTPFAALVILLLAPEFFAPLRNLGSHYHDRAAALAAMAGLTPLLDDAPNAPAADDSGQRWQRSPVVTVRQLTLQPPGAAHPILANLSLQAAAGEWLAITGSSGSGKSSLADALLGFAPVNGGQILLDDHPLEALDATELRANLGWLGQQPRLFNGSLAVNICPDPNRRALTALEQAASNAALTAVIAALPQGLNSPLREDGSGLSGGEKQRLALARALYHRPRLLILDEPTASLDGKTERDILSALRRQAGDTTIIMFTHSAAAAAAADRQLAIDDLTEPAS